MALVVKRIVMTLYSDEKDPYSHQVRMVLAEKGVNVEIKHIERENFPENISDVNPYKSLPTLIDRDLVLYHAPIIMEYLDERFPHPPLLPVYPVARANSRKMLFRIENDWYNLMRVIYTNPNSIEANQARVQLKDSLISLAPIFESKAFFLSDEFSLVDCCIIPILWRLPELGIELSPSTAQAVLQYAQRMFERETFKTSLSDVEKEVRAA